MIKEMISIKENFQLTNLLQRQQWIALYRPKQREGALRLKATMLQSCYLRNDGNGKFTMIPLPNAGAVCSIEWNDCR